jgi:phosphoesterase RecJ-like protein
MSGAMKSSVDFLREGSAFRIYSHVDPDGDALGSALGLAWILDAAGKSARVRLAAPVPRMYAFLPGQHLVERGESAPVRGERIVVLDCTSPSRLHTLEAEVTPGTPVLNVDHHADNTRFGDVVLLDPGAAATALIVLELARAGDLPVPPEAATCLYTGILTDTGRFTYANSDERALRAAAELAGAGANPAEIAAQVFEHRPVAAIRLLGRALETLDVREEGRVACIHVTQAMLAETGAAAEETEGFAAWARAIDGVQVGIFLRESQDGFIKVSFRSTGGVPIDGVASRFGGGGHPAAAGARIPGPLETAKEGILRAVGEHLQARAR